MTALVIYGSPVSTYVRTARMACMEKQVAYELDQKVIGSFDDLGSAEHRKLHPFAKMPMLSHGDFVLYETAAICRYIDEAFEGPALQPAEVKDRAVMEQWISACIDYIYPALITNYVVPYVMPSGPDGQPDRAVIEAALPRLHEVLDIIEQGYGEADYLAGGQLTTADLLLAPMLFYVGAMPEGAEALSSHPNIQRAQAVIQARDSFQATMPPMG